MNPSLLILFQCKYNSYKQLDSFRKLAIFSDDFFIKLFTLFVN